MKSFHEENYWERAKGKREWKLAVYEMFEVINFNLGGCGSFLEEVVYDYYGGRTEEKILRVWKYWENIYW